MSLRTFWQCFFSRLPHAPIACDTRDTGSAAAPRVLILTGSKRNQNYYRDIELARQTRSLMLTEDFDFAAHDWDVERIAQVYFAGRPDWIFVNYIQSYSHKLHGFDRLSVPVLGFVGDHYNFTDTTPAAQAKQAFFRSLPLAALVSAYPHTNSQVAEALGQPQLPFIYLPWAIDSTVFYDLGKKRSDDIACMGALTEGKYPFRRQVRAWLESQHELRLFARKRVKGRGGSDHDGEAFNLALNRVKAAFTCASSMHYLLMKYFEIPAAGTLLFAEHIPDLDSLGFIAGVHYVAVTPDDFSERMRYFLKGAGVAEGERIRRAGHTFVHERHTWPRRINGFLIEVQGLLGGAGR